MSKSSLLVAAMIEGIKLGHDFPAVDIVKVGEGFYRMAAGEQDLSGFYDGGHHRAVAHYIKSKPLKCNLVEHLGIFPNHFGYMEDVIMDSTEQIGRLIPSLEYLPRNIAEKFCLENKLDPYIFLVQ